MLGGRSPHWEEASSQGVAHGGKLDAIAPSKGRGCQKWDPAHSTESFPGSALVSAEEAASHAAVPITLGSRAPPHTVYNLQMLPGCFEHSLDFSTVFFPRMWSQHEKGR